MSISCARLGELIAPAKVRRAGTGVYPVLSMTMRSGLVNQSEKFKKRVASVDTAQYKVVGRNQLVVGFPIDEGVLAFQKLYDEAVVSPAYDIWNVTSPTLIDNRFLELFLRSSHALFFYSSKLRGTTARRRTLPDDIFLSLAVPLPLLSEQRRIAKILDQAEALRSKRTHCLKLLDGALMSLFVSDFGNPAEARTGESLTLEDVADKITDGEHLTPKRSSSGVKLLSARNVHDGYLDLSDVDYVDEEEYQRIRKRCDPQYGDLLISCSGTIGRVATIEMRERFSLVRSVALLKPKTCKVRAKYLEMYLRTPYMKAKMLASANASSQANLFQGQIRALPILLPDLCLQDRFIEKCTSLENTRELNRSFLRKLDSMTESLQYHAFRGEL
jgi:type I restriction enzyme, S subunit